MSSSSSFAGRIGLVEPIIYGSVSALLWTVPLLNRLHVESMAILAVVAFFVSGFVAHRRFQDSLEIEGSGRRPRSPHLIFRFVLGRRLVWLVLPGAMMTVAMFWAPNCDYWRGLSFFFLFPVVTTIFSVSLASALASRGVKFRYQILLGAFILIAGPIYDIGFHPQFYTYNHIFGGVLGPIYDEALVVRPGIYSFRLLTLLWAGLFYCVGAALRARTGPDSVGRARTGFGVYALLIGLAYLFAAQLGFNTPERYLQSQFSGVQRTPHFDIYYDVEETDSSTVGRWAVEHEYRYEQLRQRLETDVSGRIKSYVYPDAETRAALTGARFTSVSPVWLSSPQVHVLASQVSAVFPHELSHAFSREFGLPIIRASFSIGLVEGLAVATEPPDGRPTPDEIVAASGLLDESDSAGAQTNMPTQASLPDRIASTLSPFGFWTGRGGVSYTVMGSFVSYLMDSYGLESFKQAYPSGGFEEIYGKTVVELADEWITHLRTLNRIDLGAARRARIRFSVPSLIERVCPHWVPLEVRRHAEAGTLFAAGDAEGAIERWLELLQDYPDFASARMGWAAASLSNGVTEPALSTLEDRSRDDMSAGDLTLVGDAYALSSEPDSAMIYYAAARERYPAYARETRARLTLRDLSSANSEFVRILVSADSDSTRLEDLDRLALLSAPQQWAALVWRALILVRNEHFPEALEYLEQALLQGIPDAMGTPGAELLRQIDVWASVFAYRAGDNEMALAYAESAANAFRDAGDINSALMMEDLAKRLQWLQSDRADPVHEQS